MGKNFGAVLKAGAAVALAGALGAGKTTFVKGIAQGLGVQEPVTSPTFTIIQEYTGILPLYHIDLYRINHESELDDLGLEEYIFGDGVTVIEWPEKAAALLPKGAIRINISILDEGKRHFTVNGVDK